MLKRCALAVFTMVIISSLTACSNKPIELTAENWGDYIGVDYSWDMRDESFTALGVYVTSYEYDLTNRFFLKSGGHLNNVTIEIEQHFNGSYTNDGKHQLCFGWLNDDLEATYLDSDPSNDGVLKYSIVMPSDGNASRTIYDLQHYHRNSYGGSDSDQRGNLREDQQIRIVSITGEFVPE